MSDPGVRTDLFKSRDLNEVRLTDFFGGVSAVEDVLDSPSSQSSHSLSHRGQDIVSGQKRQFTRASQRSRPSLVETELALEKGKQSLLSTSALGVILLSVAIASKFGIGYH